jgi:tripartite-type tricarboxylate transporter receptor subunit TctC
MRIRTPLRAWQRSRAMLFNVFVGCIVAAVPAVAGADEFPSRPVRLVVPFAAGGSSDAVSRLVARKMTAAMSQPVVVENRPGAGGNLGADLVAKSKPDGYTLLLAAGSSAINVSLYSKLPFDVLRDFDPVIHLCTVNLMLVAHPSFPARTPQELVALAKDKPGIVTYASAGSGTVQHLAGEMFGSMANVKLTHVPYKGSGPALSDLIGGQVNVMFANMPGTLQHVAAGKLKAIAVTADKRSAILPELPTLAESGLAGYQATTWFGVLAPAGTPKPVIARLNAELARAVASPEVLEFLRAEGAEPIGGPPEQFQAFLRAEVERWAPVVKAAGAKAD